MTVWTSGSEYSLSLRTHLVIDITLYVLCDCLQDTVLPFITFQEPSVGKEMLAINVYSKKQ